MSVVVREAPPVRGGVEISLDRPESPARDLAGGCMSIVEPRVQLHATPHAERFAGGNLRERRSVGPAEEFRDADQLGFAIDQFSEVSFRAGWPWVDRYVRFSGFGLKATPEVCFAGCACGRRRLRWCSDRRRRRTSTAEC